MTVDDFNKKYYNYIEPGHYGLAINDKNVIEFLDKEFQKLIKHNPQSFEYSQIKLKFGTSRVYCNVSSDIIEYLETNIDNILKNEN